MWIETITELVANRSGALRKRFPSVKKQSHGIRRELREKRREGIVRGIDLGPERKLG
jgi:hypothetical protein